MSFVCVRSLFFAHSRDSAMSYLNLLQILTLKNIYKFKLAQESTRLPPMWPGFYSQIRRHMWVEFVGSLLCTERFSPSTLVSPLLKNQHLTWFVLIVNFSLQCPQLVLLSARSTRHLSKIPFLSFPFLSFLFIPKIKKWPHKHPSNIFWNSYTSFWGP